MVVVVVADVVVVDVAHAVVVVVAPLDQHGVRIENIVVADVVVVVAHDVGVGVAHVGVVVVVSVQDLDQANDAIHPIEKNLDEQVWFELVGGDHCPPPASPYPAVVKCYFVWQL